MKKFFGKAFLFAAALVMGATGAFLLGAEPSAPVSARAASEHTWSHDNPQSGAVELNSSISSDDSTLIEGYYYLSSDLDLQQLQIERLTISGNVELCLNGRTLTLNGTPIEVGQGASLTLYDCGAGGQTGWITGGTDGAIHINYGTFTMEGGAIVANTAASNKSGGVNMEYGTFLMNGGEISSNTGDTYGGGVCITGGTFTMTGGKISDNTVNVAEFGTNPTYGGGGVYVGGGASMSMSGTAEISGNTINGTIDSYGGGVFVLNGAFTMDGGTISGSTEAGVAAAGYYGFGSNNAKCTVTGGTVSDNRHGIRMQHVDVTLGGTPVFSGNTDENAACDLYYDGRENMLGEKVNGSITLLPDLQNVRIGLVFAPDALPRDGILTSGYFQDAEELFYLGESRTDVKLLPMETEVYGDNGPETVTELALACHFSLIIEGVEAPISGDYIYNTYLNGLLYTYDDNQNLILQPEIEQLLVKQSDEDYHYTFSQFENEQGEPYDFEKNDYPLVENTVLYAAFEGSSHVWDSWQENGETHIHTCGTCKFSAEAPWGDWVNQQDGQTHKRFCPDECGAEQTANHTWGDWSDNQDGVNHKRICTDGCGAEELSQHSWGVWTDSGDGVNHYHICTQDGCTAREERAHAYPDQWTQKDNTLHAQLCEDCQYELTADHTWGVWTDSEDGQTHIRVCTYGCGATQSADHTWGAWTDSGDGVNHYHVCTADGCTAREEAAHAYPNQWTKKDDTLHSKLCEDCDHELTADHTWGVWTDSEDGQTHTRACADGCGATQSADHTWGVWTDSGDGQTHYHVCTADGCTAREEAAHAYPNQWAKKK